MCAHDNFRNHINIVKLVNDAGEVVRYCAEIEIRCADCAEPFRFFGLPCGLDLNGASMSVDGSEARLSIAPANQTLPQVNGPTGFAGRKTPNRRPH